MYFLTRTRGKTSKLQLQYKMITWINSVFYRIQRHLRAKMMEVHLDRLVPYLGTTQDDQPWGGSSI
jgi:hypothetical protein